MNVPDRALRSPGLKTADELRQTRSHDGELPAIDDDLGAGDEGSVVRGQEGVCRCHFGWLARTAQRDVAVGIQLGELVSAEVCADGRVQRCLDVPGTKGVDADAVLP